VSFGSNTPVEDDNDMWSNFKFNHAIKETDFYAITKFADNEYVPAYRLPLVAGRNLQPSDTAREFLVNESVVKSLGIKNPQEVLNKEISLWNNQMNGAVVGVLKDFHHASLHKAIEPWYFKYKSNAAVLSARLAKDADFAATLEKIKEASKKVYGDAEVNVTFMDETVQKFYESEQRISKLERSVTPTEVV